MRILLFPIAFVFAFSSFASINTELDNSREVSDLMLLLDEGKYFSSINLTKQSSETSTKYLATQSNFSTTDTDTFGASLEFGKVLAGDMSVSITVPYDFSDEDSTTYGPGSTIDGTNEKTKASGLNDIDLDFKWRAVNQAEQGFNVDVKLDLSPKTGSAEDGSSSKDGNAYRGGTDFGVGVEVGKKMANVQVSGEFNLDFNGSRDIKDLSDGSITEISSYTNFELGGSLQFEPNDKFFINLAMTLFSGADFSTTSEGTITEYDAGSTFLIGGALGYNVSKASVFRFLFATSSIDRDISQGTANFEQEIDVLRLQGSYIIEF